MRLLQKIILVISSLVILANPLSAQGNRGSISGRVDLTVTAEPCSENAEKISKLMITDEDKGEIVRNLVDMTIESLQKRPKEYVPPQLILLPANVDGKWLTTEQMKKVRIMDRDQIQIMTENFQEQEYFSISEMTQRGQCIAVTVFNNWTVKGQQQDANMAGGGMVYEFRKVGSKWTGIFFSGWIS